MPKGISSANRIANLPRSVLGRHLPCLLLTFVVLMLVTSVLPLNSVQGATDWDVVWTPFDAAPPLLPEDDDPAWTRSNQGTTSRGSEYLGTAMNITLPNAAGNHESYSRTLSYASYIFAETRFSFQRAVGEYEIRLDDSTETNYFLVKVQPASNQLTISGSTHVVTASDSIILPPMGTSNHTLSVYAKYVGPGLRLVVNWNHDIVYRNDLGNVNLDKITFNFTNEITSTTYLWLNYMAYENTGEEAQITDLQNEIDALEKELEKLKKQTNPDMRTNETELPTIPYRNRGIDDDLVFIDPYETIVATVKAEGTGTSVALHLPYSTSADEVTCIQDDLWIGGTFTRIYINTTGAVSLLDSTSTYTYFGDLDCQNVTVETIGGDVIANRITVVREINSFNWGWNRDSGIFGHTSTISNSISYNMENVRIYWALPDEDADGRVVNVDGSSIEVWDADNNLELDRGKHWEATEIGGISLEYRWVNTTGTSASRTIRIQFTRASLSQGESYYTVYDNDISIADTYGNAPFTANIHHTQHGAANFEGKIIIRFDLTGRYAGEHIDTRTLVIKRSDQSGSSEFTYDSISNELRITDVTVNAGDSITFSLYWDWYDEKSAVYELILGDPLVLYSLLLLAGVAGFLHIVMATKEETKKKIVGAVIIIVDVAILIIILLVS